MKKTRLGAIIMATIVSIGAFAFGITKNVNKAQEVGEDRVTFHFLNVNSIAREDTGGPIGSADCIFIEDHGVYTLVDTGSEYRSSNEVVVNYIKNLGVTRIDNLFLSHHHDDHVGGVPAVVDAFDVVNAYYTLPKDWTKVRPIEMDWDSKYYYDNTITAIREKVNSDGSLINVIVPDEEGKVYKISDDSSFTVYNCLAVINNNYREPEFNDFSMMMKYTYKGVNALLTGDINLQYEYVLTGNVTKDGKKCESGDENAIAPVGKIQLLKVAHHGTEGSLHTENLLNSINPSKEDAIAVITGYRANIGASTVGRLAKYGYETKVTHDGNVRVFTDGTLIGVEQDIVE